MLTAFQLKRNPSRNTSTVVISTSSIDQLKDVINNIPDGNHVFVGAGIAMSQLEKSLSDICRQIPGIL